MTSVFNPPPEENQMRSEMSEVERVESTLHGRLAMARARYEAAVIACDEAEREGRSVHAPIPRREPPTRRLTGKVTGWDTKPGREYHLLEFGVPLGQIPVGTRLGSDWTLSPVAAVSAPPEENQK